MGCCTGAAKVRTLTESETAFSTPIYSARLHVTNTSPTELQQEHLAVSTTSRIEQQSTQAVCKTDGGVGAASQRGVATVGFMFRGPRKVLLCGEKFNLPQQPFDRLYPSP
jgi:hypothetical protein